MDRSLYNKDILNELSNYLHLDENFFLNLVLKSKKPINNQTLKMLDIIKNMIISQKRQELMSYFKIAKTIVFLLNNQDTIISIYYKNRSSGDKINEIIFYHEDEQFFIGINYETSFKYSIDDFFTNLVYILEFIVKKCPSNYYTFISIMKSSRYVDLIEDLPLQPTIFRNDSFQFSNDWFLKYIFSQHQIHQESLPFHDGEPLYLQRKYIMRINIPIDKNISKILKKISINLKHELSDSPR